MGLCLEKPLRRGGLEAMLFQQSIPCAGPAVEHGGKDIPRQSGGLLIGALVDVEGMLHGDLHF